MLYVQIPSAFRASWGLKTNPSSLGRRLDVTGSLSAYFSMYYASAIGKTGSALHAELHRIIPSGVTTLTYDQVWTALEDTDQDPDNASNVIEVYSGHPIAKSDNGGGVDQWNREHVRAKSHGGFGTVNGPGTDVHTCQVIYDTWQHNRNPFIDHPEWVTAIYGS